MNSVWGKLLRESEKQVSGYSQNLRMQGQYLDRETGLHYNLFRYYDPDCGRFTQQDTQGQWEDKPLPVGAECDWVGLTSYTLIHDTAEEEMKDITKSGVIRPSTGDILVRFEDGQYFINIIPEMIGGLTLQRY